MFTAELVEGWSGPLDFELTDGEQVIDFTGLDSPEVSLYLTGADNVAVATLERVTIQTPAAGVVRYIPREGDLLSTRSPYRARFKVSSLGGYPPERQSVFFPNSEPMIWNVNPVT